MNKITLLAISAAFGIVVIGHNCARSSTCPSTQQLMYAVNDNYNQYLLPYGFMFTPSLKPLSIISDANDLLFEGQISSINKNQLNCFYKDKSNPNHPVFGVYSNFTKITSPTAASTTGSWQVDSAKNLVCIPSGSDVAQCEAY